ncbi:hypothetical protein LOD99_10071 [Oopsacas minuta]|uniref:Uncharacterized protein n=1 Tax=Oopsacas minuta TaxID=111878 RepID=A0AAV7KIV1_9METZ|nr:hypothetical protein LOD99_10071 [Oopsacas minuta]
MREKGERGRNREDSRLRLQRDKELEGRFQNLLEESQKKILNLQSEVDSYKLQLISTQAIKDGIMIDSRT